MLASLLNTPRTAEQWQAWSFANYQDIVEIQQAIQAQRGISLTRYILYPIPPDDVQGWLARNQNSLDDINGTLLLQGTDLQIVDLTDAKQLQGWVYTLYQQHYAARAALRI